MTLPAHGAPRHIFNTGPARRCFYVPLQSSPSLLPIDATTIDRIDVVIYTRPHVQLPTPKPHTPAALAPSAPTCSRTGTACGELPTSPLSSPELLSHAVCRPFGMPTSAAEPGRVATPIANDTTTAHAGHNQHQAAPARSATATSAGEMRSSLAAWYALASEPPRDKKRTRTNKARTRKPRTTKSRKRDAPHSTPRTAVGAVAAADAAAATPRGEASASSSGASPVPSLPTTPFATGASATDIGAGLAHLPRKHPRHTQPSDADGVVCAAFSPSPPSAPAASIDVAGAIADQPPSPCVPGPAGSLREPFRPDGRAQWQTDTTAWHRLAPYAGSLGSALDAALDFAPKLPAPSGSAFTGTATEVEVLRWALSAT
jgi:hypothetical protein